MPTHHKRVSDSQEHSSDELSFSMKSPEVECKMEVDDTSHKVSKSSRYLRADTPSSLGDVAELSPSSLGDVVERSGGTCQYV